MQTYCDRCNETVDHPIGITADPELKELALELGYRSVCSGCYDDLLAEAAESRELHGDGDRREEARIPVAISLTLEPIDGSGERQAVVAEDISHTGVRVRGVRHLDRGSVVRLTTDGTSDVDAVAIVEIVWRDGETMHAGLHLVEESESWTRVVAEHAERLESL